MKLNYIPSVQILTLALILFGISPIIQASHTPDPSAATIAGSLQDELGCPGDWQPDCAVTHLGFDADDQVWQGTFAIPAGSWEYKAALNDSWDVNYGDNATLNGPNIPLSLGDPTDVKFYYDHKTHWITDNVNSVIATAAGSFQGELGCPGDWQPWCLRSWLQDPDGDGIFVFETSHLPAGDYETNVAHDEDWAENYGAGGVPGGANIPFNVPADCADMRFEYDLFTHILFVSDAPPPAQPASVTIVGGFQKELGCPGDWQPDCAVTHLGFDADDQVWQGTFAIPAGSWEYKAALNDSWDVNYGDNATLNGPNIPLDLGAVANVKFYYSDETHWVTSNQDAVIAALAGNFQDELGCPGDWQPWCLRSWLQDPDGDGIYTFSTAKLPAGDYEVKVAHDEAWDENYGQDGVPGGANIPFNVPASCTEVFFTYDPVTHLLSIGSGPPPANTTPVAEDDAYSTLEDVFLHVPAPGTLANDMDADGDPLTAVQDSTTSNGSLTLNVDGSFDYDPNANFCGSDSFTYHANDGLEDSNVATVSITVTCVNDPPLVTDVTPKTGTVDYSDHIGQVTITIEDIDSNLGPLHPSIRFSPTNTDDVRPPNLPSPRMNDTEVCEVVENDSIMDGSRCTYTLDGQIFAPGNRVYNIGFKGFDEAGNGPECNPESVAAGFYTDVSECRHVLTVHPEDATAVLSDSNNVAFEVEDDVSGAFDLWFSAWEINNLEDMPCCEDTDIAHDGGTAGIGDMWNAHGMITLEPVGPGSKVEVLCGAPDSVDGVDYAQVALFECSFDDVPVNTYEVVAKVKDPDDSNDYYAATAEEGVLVIYDPSLGFTTGGGWFYWPETMIPEDACLEFDVQEPYDCIVPTPCRGYLGDKTNFGFNFKYNKKQTNIQGNLLMVRHSIDTESCVEGNYKVKSNKIDGMGLGTAADAAGDYGWATVSGKATFRDMTEYNTGGNAFLLYVEDHGEQGCNQGSSDEIWIEVLADNAWIDPMPGDPANEDGSDSLSDHPIECGNVVVPQKSKGGKGKPDK